MRCFYVLLLSLFLLTACSEERREDDAAAKAAKEYYDHLFGGRYIEYVSGFADTDSLPPSYREQLVVNAKQFVAQQKEAHGDVCDIRIVTSKTDSVAGRTDAFLLLAFADSAKEEIVVPMVERGGRWVMK